jgi:hypothetical protein
MKTAIFIVSIYLFSSFQIEQEISYKFAGNPDCFYKGKDYVLKAKLMHPNVDEYLFLSAKGTIVKKLEATDTYQLSFPMSSESAELTFSIRNNKTKKTRQIESIDFKFCE